MAVISGSFLLAKEGLDSLAESFAPDIPKLPEPPSLEDPEIQRRRKQEKRRLMARQGFRSTILTSPPGVPDEGVRQRTLLG